MQRGNVFSGTSGRNENGGTAFDPKAYYGYTLDNAADVPSKVKSGAGPRSTIGTAATTAAAATTHRGAGRLGSVQDRAGRRRRRTGEQHLTGSHLHQARHVPGDGEDPVHQAARHPPGHRRQPQGHRDRLHNSAGTAKPGGGTYGTAGSATVAVEAGDFQARNLTVSNDFDEKANQNAGGHQAVALRTAADKVFLDSVIITGDQDTLELETAAADKLGRAYVRNSYVVGNVDFIFGRAGAVIPHLTDAQAPTRRSPTGRATGPPPPPRPLRSLTARRPPRRAVPARAYGALRVPWA